MIKRQVKQEVIEQLNQFPAVALLGPRQVGKTTLAKTIASSRPSVYVDLELDSDRQKLAHAQMYLTGHSDKLVVLDEIQHAPELFSLLRALIDRRQQTGQYLIVGSASIELLKQTQTLAGRISFVELHPVDLRETEDSDRLWVRGGFPCSLLSSNSKESFDWRKNFIRTYLERDIRLFAPRMPATTLQRLWTMLAHLQGQLFNAAHLARGLAVDNTTIARHVDLMVDLLLVRRLEPYRHNVGKRLIKSPKVYVRDSGLVHSLLNIEDKEALLSHPVVANSWEGFVIENIIRSAPPTATASFYRTSAGAEIDLLLEMPGPKIWAIEIKFGLTPKLQRGFHHARRDLNPKRCLVVYSGSEHYRVSDAVEAIGLRQLCGELQSMH